jgi:dynein heavy chain 2
VKRFLNFSYFRQQKLQFRPPFEEVRAKYYREMKKFISIPLHFRGVSDDTSIYPPLIEHHASAFSVVYAKAEELFSRLSKILDDFKDWVILGMVDIDAMVDEHLQSTGDWEKNFKAIKAKGREAEKLPG